VTKKLPDEERIARRKARAKAYREANREKVAAGIRDWKVRNRERVAETNREWTAANREKINERERSSYKTDPDKYRDRSRAKYRANRESEMDRARAYRAANPDKFRTYARRSTLRRRYGITEDQFFAMLADQDGRCLVCEVVFMEDRPPAVDHCHETGVVRGLLCRKCNTGIAMFDERPEVAERAAAYLRDRCEPLKVAVAA
jgi:hypothetical protein